MDGQSTDSNHTQNSQANNLQLTDISSNHLKLLAWVLERYGMDVNQIFADVGVNIPTTNSPIDRVPLVFVIRVLEHIREISGDPCICLNLYQHMKLTHLNVLGFALSCSSTLFDFFQRAERFWAYIGSAFMVDIEERDDSILIHGRWNTDIYNEQLKNEPGAQLLLESFSYSAIGILQEAYGGPVPAKKIYLQGKPHKQIVAAFKKACNAPVSTGNDFVGMEIDKKIANVTLPGANPQLARENDQQVIDYLAAINQTDIVHRCERLIIEGMPVGDFNLKLIAQKLGMSERVLHQNLRNQGQSFSGLLNRIRKTLAIQHLQEGKKNISQIAYLLGFDSPSNFSRAFRSWTGQSPREYKNTI